MLLNEKIERWMEKAKKGEEGYECIYLQNDKRYIYRCGNYIGQVTAMSIRIWDSDNSYLDFDPENITSEAFPAVIGIVIKDEKKLAVLGSKGDIQIFGTKDNDVNSKNAIIVYQCGGLGSIMAAHENMPDISILTCLPGARPDALFALLKNLQNGTQEGREEGHEYQYES